MAKARWRRLDFWLLLAAVMLVGYGLLLVHSATHLTDPGGPGRPSAAAMRQGLLALAGLGGLLVLALVDYRWYYRLAYPAYLASLALLALTPLLGHGEEYGVRRWLGYGPLALQPSEPAKLCLVLALARFFADGGEGAPSLRRVLASLPLVAAPVVLVYWQPDLGTALVLVAIWGGVLLVAGTRAWHLVGLAAAGLAALPLVWLSLRDYMRQRVLIFLQPESDPFGEGYNILQAKISIGAGGLFGRGLTNGTQTQLRYLRVSHSDFIFAVLAEELGLVGVLVLFTLVLVLLFRVLRAAELARDPFGRLAATGVAAMIGFQAVVNIGANLTLLPVTGIPLPFISLGGSALLTNLAALGVVQSVVVHRLRFRF
ncbi:MAG TPA: rod shape-determining protein RodA [Chloroflexota bacterium]|nr:rod shape-determining protein RodA [Chloroflexota bacterium]